MRLAQLKKELLLLNAKFARKPQQINASQSSDSHILALSNTVESDISDSNRELIWLQFSNITLDPIFSATPQYHSW